MLHAGAGRDGWRRAGHGDAGQRVDDGDGVAGAGGGGLVELEVARELRLVVGGRDEGRRRRVEREDGRDLLGLLGGRAGWRVARQRRPLRRAAVDGNKVALG